MMPPFGLPEPVTFPLVFEWAVARHGAREAIVTDEERIRYDELAARVRQTAAAMVALGVRRGDHVGILMGNSVAWVTLFYAAAYIGAVTVPINTRFRLDELRYCLRQADVATLFFAGKFLRIDFLDLLTRVEPAIESGLPGTDLPLLRHAVMLGDHLAPRCVTPWRVFAQVAASLEAVARERSLVMPDDTLLVQYTSGTTSFPKGVMLSHRSMLQNAAAVGRRIGVRPDDRYFSIRPFSHVGGSTMTLLVSLIAGATVLTLPTYDVGRTLQMMRDERCTLASGNDTIFQMLMAHERFDRSTLRLRGGWAAVGPEVMRRIFDVLGATDMVNAYGLSEASPNVVMHDWQDPPELRIQGWALPHPGVEVRIVDPETLAVQPPRHPGEIQVRGWNVMQGYYGKPAETAAAMAPDGWLRSGDLGEMNDEGRIRMIGRLKDIFRVGGENVAPAEVEETILGHPKVEMVQVVGVPDARLLEVPAAYVQPKAGVTLTEAEIIEWCVAHCATFKVPRYLRIVPSFEWAGMTSSGKIQKKALREHAIRDFGLDGATGPVT